MGLLTQLGLLFKKNLILRKRQPGILVLELVWPVLIVAVVALIRQGVPLGKRDTCHFQERAMPSAGVVPFLQTFVCNLDNQCHSTYTLNRAKETTYSVSKLVQQLAPTLASDDVIQGLLAMDKGVEMMDALSAIANDSDALSGFDLTVRGFFRDPNYVKQVLVGRFGVMDEEQVDAFLDSTVNITLIFDLIGYPDFRTVACDPAKLSKYLLFKPNVDVRDVSSSICNISIDMIPQITDFLQSQFDIAQLVRTMGKFEKLKQRLGRPYTSSQAFTDIADMIDLALKSPTLVASLSSISSLRKLPDIIRNLPQMIGKLEQFGYFDMTPFVKLVHAIDPVVEELKPNDTIWYAVKYGVLMAADISEIVQGRGNGSMSDLITRVLQSAMQMGDAVQQLLGNMGQDLQLALGAIAKVDWTGIYDQLFNQTMNTQSTIKSLKDLQASLQQVPEVWNITAPIVMVMSRFMEMGNIVLEETNDLENVLLDMVNKAGPTQTALANLFNKGPNITLAVLAAFTDSKAMAKLFESPFSYQSFCNDILDEVSNMTSPETVAELRPVLCNNDISTTMDNLVTSLRVPDIQQIMNETVIKIMRTGLYGYIPTAEANFTVLFLRLQQMTNSFSTFMHLANATWRNVITNFQVPNVDLTHRQWEPVLDQLNENYVASGMLALARGFMIALDSGGKLNPVIGNYIHMASIITRYGYDVMKVSVELYSPSSPLGRLVQMMSTYAPEMIRAMSNMAQNTQQMIAIVSIPDPMSGMCEWIKKMPLPSYVPHEDMAHIICNQLPKVLMDVMSSQNYTAQLVQELNMMFSAVSGQVYSVTKDWTEVMDYTERIIDMMQHPENIMAFLEGPGALMSSFNFSRMGETMTVMGDILKRLTYKDMASMVDISLAVMRQLDPMFLNSMEWRGVKHMVLTANSYMKLVNHYYGEVLDTNSDIGMITNYSPDLRNYINKMAAVTPDFLDALKNAVLNPEKLVKKFLDSPTGLVAPDCSSHWVSDFLMVGSNSSVRDFEQMTCTLNWTAVALEITDRDPYIMDIRSKTYQLMIMDWSNVPEVHVNWTEVMINTEHFLGYLTGQTLQMTGQFNFAPFNVSAIDMKWTQFLSAAQSLQNMDTQRLNELMTMIQISLENLGFNFMSQMNMTDDLLLNSMYGNIYITHHFMTFANKILMYMSSNRVVNLLDYMDSDELKKVFSSNEIYPVLSEIGLDSIISYLLDPSKFSVFVNIEDFGMQLCTNVTIFSTVFDLSGTTMDPATVQDRVCTSASLNYTLLYDQLRQNWDGFAEFADSMILLSHDKVSPEELRINASVIVSDQTTFNYLLNKTLYNPPTVLLTTNNDWMNVTIYKKQWENFLTELNTTLGKYQDPSFMSMWQKSVTKVLTKASLSIPGFDKTLMYMDVILDMIEKQLEQSLVSLPVAFRDYPNLSKILSLVERLPEAFLVVSFTDLAHPKMVARWTPAMQSWQTFCAADSSQLFATPPGVAFSMANFHRQLCEINITSLAAEMAAYEGTDRLNALLVSPDTTFTVNATDVAARMASLIDTLTRFSTMPMSTGLDLRIFNVSIWNNVIHKLAEYANSSMNAYSLQNLQTTLTQSVLSSLQAIPGYNTVLHYMDVILDIITEQIQRSLESLPEAFRDYPTMYTLLQLLDDLPSVVEVVAYTDFITPHKISKWATAMQSWESFCMADTNTLMTVPPGLNFNMSAFIHTICSINLTVLAEEASKYQGSDRIAKLIESGNETAPINATVVLAKLTNIINMFTQNASSLVMPQFQPSVFNESVWMASFSRINGYINQTTTDIMVSSLFATAQDVFSTIRTIPGLSSQLGGLETVMAVMETLLDRIILLENATSFALRDIFPDAPQLQAMIDIIEKLGVIPLLMNSLNSQKMTPLFMMTNVTEVFIALCYPGTDISQYLSIPPGISVDIPGLQRDFCAVNITKLEPEVMAAFDIPWITRVARGDEHVNWLVMGDKFQRVFDLITRWTQTPPQVILPPNWDNGTYWLDMLEAYNNARMSPEAINAEIENLLTRMGPLLTEEPFRQYGVVMETVLRLLNENMIALQNKSMTVTTMFDKVPILREVITALGLRADILETLMTAPVRDPRLFTQSLIATDSDSFLCNKGDIWKQLLVLPPTFDTSALTNAVCNTNTTAIVANLVQNLDLESLLAGIGNMSVMPDWKAIFTQSQELSQNINSLILNPPVFKVNESIHILEQAYNQSNLWNLVISYNILSQTFGNSSVFQGVDAYMRGAVVVVNFLNDIFQKMSVNGVTLDLGSLFSGSPTFVRLVNSILHLKPDPITGLASIQLKPSQNQAFAAIAADPTRLAAVFCNENTFRQYFTVASGFNLSSILPVLCTMNFTQVGMELDSNFMVSAMIAKMQHPGPFDLQSYMTAYEQMNSKIMELIGVRNVTFGDTNLEQVFHINTTALMEVFNQQNMAIQTDYQQYITSLFAGLSQSLGNTSEWRSVALSLKIFDVYLKYLNQNLRSIAGHPLSLALLVDNTELGHVLLPLMSDPLWLDQLLHLQLKPAKLQEMLQYPNASSVLCSSALWDAFVTPTNGTSALQYLQTQICSLNSSVLMWQTIASNAQGYQFYQQMTMLIKEFETGTATINLNTTELTTDVTDTIQLVTGFINSLMNSTLSAENFFNVGGFQSVLNNLQGTLNQRLLELSRELSTSMANLIWPQIPDQNVANTMARVINTINIFMTVINDRLTDIKDGNLTLQSLSGNHPALLSLMEAYINVTKFGLQAWMDGEIHLERIIQLISSQSMLTSQCQAGSVAVYISNSSTPSLVSRNLQTVMCTYMTGLPNEFRNLVDYQRIQQEVTNIWNTSGTVTPQFAQYTTQIQRFNQLLTEIAQRNIQMSNQFQNIFDFSSILGSLNNLAKDPTMIFRLLKPLGLVMTGPLKDPVVKTILSALDSYMILPVTKLMEVLKENGLSFMSMVSNPSEMMRGAALLGSYNTQMELPLITYARPLFQNIAKDTDFITNFLCNQTMVQTSFVPLLTPAIADMFCKNDPNTWLTRLTELGIGKVEQYGLAVKMLMANTEYRLRHSCSSTCEESGLCYSTCSSTSAIFMVGDVSWVQLLSDIEKLTKMLMNQFGGISGGSVNMTAMAPVDSMVTLWDNIRDNVIGNMIQSAFGSMKLVDILDSSAQWNGFKQVIHFVGSFNNYLNSMMEKFTNSSSEIYLQDIFPDPNEVAKLLSGVVGQDTAAEFLTASFNSITFFEKLSNPQNWQTILCDYSQFATTFKFPSRTNVPAIQQAMCSMAQNQSSSLDQMIQLFGAGKVLSEFQSLMPSQATNKTFGFSLWDTVYNSTIRLLHNLDKLQKVKVNGTSASEWFAPIISTLQALQNSNMDGTKSLATCNELLYYIGDTDMFRQVRPFIVQALGYMKLALYEINMASVADDVVCALTRDLDINRAVDLLNASGFWNLLTQTNQLVTYNGSEPLQCSAVVQTTTDLFNALNETLMGGNMADWAKMGQCFQEGSKNFRTLVTGLDSVLKVASDVIPILRNPAVIEMFNYPENLFSAVQYFINIFAQQRPVLLKFSDLLKNDSSIEMYLLNVLQMSPELVNSLLKSTINLDAMDFLNRPVEEIRNTICNATQLDQIINLPNFIDINIASLSQLLCTNKSLETAAALKSAAEATALLQQILTATQTGLDQAFFNNISTHIFNLMGDLQSITEIASIFSGGFDIEALRNNVPVIDRFLMSAGPEKIVKSLTDILEDIRKMLPPSSEANTIIREIDIFIRGFVGLDIVQSYFLEALTVVDFLERPSVVYNYLIQVVGMSPKNAQTVLEGVFSMNVFLNSSYLLDSDITCKDMFSKLIILNTTTLTVQEITDDLCHVNESVAIQITNMLIPELTIGDLIKRYVSLSADDIFKSANITAAEATALATKMSNAQNDLLQAANILNGKSTTLNLKSNELLGQLINLPQAQTSPDTVDGVQPLLCGKKPGDLAGDDFNVGSVLGTNSKATVDEEEIDELSRADEDNGGDFCQQLYKEIKNQDLGSIIWAYLKPIMRGKIVFTPNTPLSRRIIEQADSVFKTMKEVQRVAKVWSLGAPNLMRMSEKSKKMGNLKDVLKNEFISSLLKQTAGLDTKDLLSGLDALNSGNFNSSSIQGMKVAADLVVNYTSCMEMDRFIAADTEADLEKKAFNLAKTNNFLAGIVFLNIDGSSGRQKRDTNGEELPKHIQYKIRMESENVRPTNRIKSRFWQPQPDDNFPSDLQYLRGFMQLQDMIERSIVAVQTGDNKTLPGVYLKQFPFPCSTHDSYIGVLGSYLLPVVMTFAWLAALAIATRNLVYDREKGQEEAMRIMGMKPFFNWFAWLISTLLLMVIVSAILMMVLKVSQLFRLSDPTIVFLYLVCFCVSTTMMCYFVSAFFTRVTLAILTVLIVYFLTYLPYVLLVSLEVSMTFWQKTLACLFSTSAFGFAAQYLSRLEIQNIGLQWNNIATSPITGDPMTFSWACYMMLIDSAIYLILGWYIRTVMPGKFGISQPWYFPVLPSYWCPKSHGKKAGIEARSRSQNITLFESSGTGIPGMAVRNLTKKFGGKTVVDNISMDFFEGQVTALLGHNGASKTTTMNMLIGILEPSSGEVFINKKGNAGNIGYCPQHNTLLDYMTVMEHMELYAGIKCDWSASEKSNEIKTLLNDVDLYHVRDVRVNQLSGGMKRRLCVALAFVGGSTAVVLDEPTSGVDPHARKHIWNLIVKQRLERTILLSTHHLDEADTLGDTVAIMHKGHILCCGSPIFLKEKLGGGYHLTADKAIKSEADGSYNGHQSNCKSSEVLQFINTMLPNAQLVEEVGTEMTFNLPREDGERKPFSTFFNELDRNMERLCINSYGVSDTTLEDVFLKVTGLADDNISLDEDVLQKQRMILNRNRSIIETESDTTSESSSQETSVNMLDSGTQRHSGCSLKLQQMSALLLKRLHHYRRNWRMFLSIILLPTILFFVSMGFAKIRPSAEEMPKLLMTPDLYSPDTYMFYKDMSYETLSDRLANTLIQKPGVGTACMEGFDSGLSLTCDMTKRNFTPRVSPTNKDGGCVCKEHVQHCDPGSVPIPRHIKTPTGNYLQDLIGEDISLYLINSFEQFIEKRYGGWSYEIGPEGTDTEMATTVWYNNRGFHTMPAFFNAYSNSLLRAKMGETATENPSEYGISVFSHPFTFHTMKLSLNSLGTQATDAGISLVFLLAFTFIPSAFMVFLVNENLNKEKQLQFISGVGSGLYWITSFIWDLIVYSFTVAIAVAVLAIFQIGPYWERMNLAGLVVLLLLYGWAIIPMMYMTLKLFKSASSAYLTLFCVNMLIGILSVITIFTLIIFESIGMKGVTDAYNVCRYLFLIFPQFCLGQGLIDLAKNHFQYILFSRFGEDTYEDPFSFNMLAWNLVALAIEGFVFFIITIFIESRHGNGAKIPRRLLEIPDEDDDVRNERSRIQLGHTKDDILYINGLAKMYRRGLRKFLAVDNVSFGVSKGECFGLLGVNGAGKTTTFRMLTGDTEPSSGEAYLNGQKITKGDPSLGQEVGYCPQEGGLDDYLSGEELLFCHARLKGMSDEYAKKAVTDLVGKLRLAEYAQKAIHTYSGGTKRKLSLAIAMLGEPAMLFLDEPTTGMDPATRRLVWKAITKSGQHGQSIVLTSHSMDECDALCSRLAIMVNGRLMCIGSSQHLKSKFGDGYTVIMHIQGLSSNRFDIEQAFISRFPGAMVKVSVDGKDQHQSVLEVSIPRGATSVAELFNILQTAQAKNHITRYSLSQTTLDTVFVNFARDQSDSVSDKDDFSTSGSTSEQSGMLSGPFTNQTYAYMNPQYLADPEDVRFSSPSQYAANLARASSTLSTSFKGDKYKDTTKLGTSNEGFKGEDEFIMTRL